MLIVVMLIALVALFAAPGLVMAADVPTTTDQSVQAPLIGTDALLSELVVLVILVLLDFVVTAAWAIYKGVFDWDEFLRFLRTNIAPYGLTWGGIVLLLWLGENFASGNETLAYFAVLAQLIYAAMVARLLASVLGTFKNLGIEAPARE